MFIKNLAYEASAGSGKTFMLVVRYLTLLFKGADPAKILALTFTNKAALEMQERVILTLEKLEDRDELKEIVSLTQLSREEILKQIKALEEIKILAERHWFDVSKPAKNAKEAIQWIYFAFLAAIYISLIILGSFLFGISRGLREVKNSDSRLYNFQ